MTKPKVLISDALSPAAVQIFKDRGIEVDFQPALGYSWQKNYYCHETRLGVGYSAMVTGRRKNHYFPIPGLVPVASAGYKGISVQTTWVPYLGHNNGNVFLTMLQISI